MVRPGKFPLTEEAIKNIHPKTFAETCNVEFQSKVLQDIVKSDEYQKWSKIRNVLTHASGTAGRQIIVNLSTQAPPSTTYTLWVKDLLIDDFTTLSRLFWLKDTLSTLIHEVNNITKSYLT